MDQVKKQLESIKSKSKLVKEKNLELKKLNRELDNFLYSTAHDLRSPMSSMIGLINLMRYENNQPSLVHYMDMLQNSLHRSEGFISQIVSYSKNKRLDLTLEKVDMRQLIADIFEDHQFIEGAARIEKVLNVNCYHPFESDRNRITILLSNLVSNAIKYADYTKENCRIDITVEVYRDEALIEVSDNGLGIDQKYLGNIFDMFFRAHHHSKGSGLGLFIFHETLTRLGGKVSVTSEVGAGTTFSMCLPNMVAISQRHQDLSSYALTNNGER
jgi:signal transduction histidine kinase